MSDYIPSKEPEKLMWLLHFGQWLTDDSFANALAHGLTEEEACGYYTTAIQASLARLDTDKKHAAAHGKKFEGRSLKGERRQGAIMRAYWPAPTCSSSSTT